MDKESVFIVKRFGNKLIDLILAFGFATIIPTSAIKAAALGKQYYLKFDPDGVFLWNYTQLMAQQIILRFISIGLLSNFNISIKIWTSKVIGC